MAAMRIQPSDYEKQVIDLGRRLLTAAQRSDEGQRPANLWLEKFLEKAMEDERFRIQALRFVDVLPALDDDQELARHLNEYFGEEDFPLPDLVKFGVRHVRAGVASTFVAKTVRAVMQGLARRFLGGANPQEALSAAKELRGRGLACSLDLLGEAVVSEAEAERYQQTYLRLFDELPPKVAGWADTPLLGRRNGRAAPRLNVSIKPSSLYSQITPLDPEGGMEGIAERLRPVLRAARRAGAFVCVDMEQYDWKAVILSCFKRLMMENEFRDWPDVGIAMQAYLTETEEDLRGLVDWAKSRGSPITVRLVRGAYWDSEVVIARQNGWPLPVWGKKWQTDACYERCLHLLLENHPHVETAVATHNVRCIALAMVLAKELGLRPDQFEFQMLHGMARSLEDVFPEMDYLLRVYVPFGELLPGMAYLVRRLIENSSSQSFQRINIARNLSPGQLLASPHGHEPDRVEAASTLPEPGANDRSGPVKTMGEEDLTSLPAFHNESVHRFTQLAERQAFQEALKRVRAGLGATYPLWIDGRAVDSGKYLSSHNPARFHEVVGRVALADTQQAEAAVTAARKAFPEWSGLAMAERVKFLLDAARHLRGRRDEFAAFEVFEAGKTWREADADVTETIDYLEYYAREALRLGVPASVHVPGESNLHVYRARGVGLILPPWNFPLGILTGMLSAAIVAGNTVILKPSSQTPVIAARFVELLNKVGLPPGVVQFLAGPGGAVGEYLVSHPQINFIAFTGSEEVGTRILRLAAQLAPGQAHIKHVVAEMGGKNAIIVDSDADLDDAVAGILQSAFGYQGQKCSACSRVMVVGGGYGRFIKRLSEATQSLRMGPPDDPGVFLGPVIDGAARDRIQAVVEEGKSLAKLEFQRACPGLEGGYFIGPAIFGDVPPDAPLARKEIFGPVLSVLRAKDMDEAITLANRSIYALTGGIYSRSPVNIAQVREGLEAGNLYINRKITGALVARQPFGGFKLSGTGSKAGGPDYLLHFVRSQTITENTLRRGFAPIEGGLSES
jgi:RHH-type proline utilization regulon transcriptional repressor/proline dehydrogenase/delta 1-pyrroline-5-carboxylate dehydrogenase